MRRQGKPREAGTGPGVRARRARAMSGKTGARAHLLNPDGELKHIGAGERCGNDDSAAACASETPCARSAREGVMGDSAFAKSRNGDDRSDACERSEDGNEDVKVRKHTRDDVPATSTAISAELRARRARAGDDLAGSTRGKTTWRENICARAHHVVRAPVGRQRPFRGKHPRGHLIVIAHDARTSVSCAIDRSIARARRVSERTRASQSRFVATRKKSAKTFRGTDDPRTRARDENKERTRGGRSRTRFDASP